MTPERWRQVTEIFHAALALDASARARYLNEACADDASLRKEVDAMLAGDAEGRRFGERAVTVSSLEGPRLTAGTVIGSYRIERLIGTGGMGEVYRARDTRLDRTVAIKVLPERLGGERQFRERFEREARALAMLSHPHICQVFDVGREHEVSFLVLEYVEGETLASRIERGALPFKEALQIGIQIAGALAVAHGAGIVHRDLKPGNVMWTKVGPKLLDFGLAKATASTGNRDDLSRMPTVASEVTEQGTILGTVQYMAPEQLEGRQASAQTDIFAFGGVLFEMLTGRRAFEGDSHASLIGAILKDQPPCVSTLQPLASGILDHILARCLAKDPAERWQSATDVQRELEWVRQGGPGLSAIATGTKTRRTRTAWVLAALSTAVAVAVIALSFFRAPTEAGAGLTRLDVVTPSTNDAFSFAISPDGRQLAFVANSENVTQLWLRPLDEATARPLAGTEGAAFPFWAPDSRGLAFFADGKLKRIDTGGSASQVLADVPTARGGAWRRDGFIVIGQGAGGLVRVSASGGALAEFTQVTKGQNNHRWPQFLPDGRVLFFATGEPDVRGVYVTSRNGGESVRVIDAETAAAYASPGYLLRVSQGTLMAHPFDLNSTKLTGEPIAVAQGVGSDDGLYHAAMSTSDASVLAHRAGTGGRRQLTWLDRSGRLLGSAAEPDTTGTASPDLALDDRRVLVQQTVQGNNDVWMVDSARATASRLTFSAAIDAFPVWSPDGTHVVFTSLRSGTADIFEKPANGAREEMPLVVTTEPKTPLHWSPDGSLLLYANQSAKTQGDLWAVSLKGDRKPFPVVQSRFDDVQGQFSPDGQWLAYGSNESGRYEVYVRPFRDDGGPWQISNAGGAYPRWRRDGRELYYIAPDNRLMSVSVELDAKTRTVNWGVATPLFAARFAAGVNIFAAGAQSRAQYAVASDGRFLVNMQVDDPPSPINLILNWQAVLR